MQGTAQSRAEGCDLRCLGREGDGGGEGTTLRRTQTQTPMAEQSTGGRRLYHRRCARASNDDAARGSGDDGRGGARLPGVPRPPRAPHVRQPSSALERAGPIRNVCHVSPPAPFARGPGGALDGWRTWKVPRGAAERRVDARGRHKDNRRAARVDATRGPRANASCRGRKSTRAARGARGFFDIKWVFLL